jgi:sigma-B regulation protein RsbU (phosphoserine phosphatase)
VATGDKGKVMKKFSVDLGVGIAGWVAKNKKPLLVEDCYKDPRFSPDYDKKSKFKTRDMICVPLIRKRQLLGVMQVINKKGDGGFRERDLKIFETLASQCAIAIENHNLVEKQVETEALERELDTAREIQQKLLPASLPEYEDIQIAARLIPAKQVGGDYYNIQRINDRQSLFFVADVTGKGIPAALIVSTIYSCMNSYLKLSQDKFDLMNLVTAMNRVLIESTTSTRFATCWFGLYDHDSKRLVSINAGHNPPYIFRENNTKPIELHKGGLFLGGLDVPYEMEEMHLRQNDVLVFFTDGVTEAWNEKEDEYEEYRLIQCVFRNIKESAQTVLAEIEKDVNNHVGKAQQSDDFTCAVVKIQ